MAGCHRIIIGRTRYLACQFFKRLPLRLRDEICGNETTQHEESEDLHDVFQPR